MAATATSSLLRYSAYSAAASPPPPPSPPLPRRLVEVVRVVPFQVSVAEATERFNRSSGCVICRALACFLLLSECSLQHSVPPPRRL